MSKYKLTYFNFRCRAEVCRYLFALAGVEYEDHRLDWDDWQSGKINKESLGLPFGQLPVLSIDGVNYSQSLSLERYLAEKFGFAGKTDLDKLRCDMIAHCVEDVLLAVDVYFIEKDPIVKGNISKKFQEEKLHPYMVKFENMLKENGGGDGYVVGDSLTRADLSLLQLIRNYLTMIGMEPQEYIDAYPKLHALVRRLEKDKKIAAWYKKRPITEF
jgi:glutathione S-transferase